MLSEHLEMKDGFSMITSEVIKEESRFGVDQKMSENVTKVSANQTKRRLGNVKDDYDGLSPDDHHRLRLKRERNKLAAARCRQRRENLIHTLSDQLKKSEAERCSHLRNIEQLRQQKMALEELLVLHKANGCVLSSSQGPLKKPQRPVTLDLPPGCCQTYHYPLDTPESLLNAFDTLPTGLSPSCEHGLSDVNFFVNTGKFMAIL